MRTPFGDRSPWESTTAWQNKTRDKEKEEEKVRRLKIILEQSKRQGQFFDTPETRAIKQEIERTQSAQNRVYKGLLSGVHGFGLHEANQNVSKPVQMQPGVELPNDDGISLNPFKHLGKAAMAGLEGWQKTTEWWMGNISTPFSQQVQRNRSRGMSAGEAWRQAEFATVRIGKEKGEGFGFNLGVKGAAELIGDPIGWATMAIPLGAIARPIGKGISTMASALPGVKQVRKGGKELLKEYKGIDNELRNLDLTQKNLKDFFKALDKNTVKTDDYKKWAKSIYRGQDIRIKAKSGRILDLDDIKNTTIPNTEVFDPSNYDSTLEALGVNNEGLISDFLRYANSDRVKGLSRYNPGRYFMTALKNTHKILNPAYTLASTREGRALLAFNDDIVKGDSLVTSIVSKFRKKGDNLKDILDKHNIPFVNTTRQVKLGDGVLRNEEQALITIPIGTEKVISNERNAAMESVFGYGKGRILTGEKFLGFEPLTGKWSIYDVNGVIYGGGILESKGRNRTLEKFAQEVTERSGLDDKEIAGVVSKLNASADNMSAWETMTNRPTTLETGIHAGKGHKIKYNSGQAYKVDTYVVDFSPANEAFKLAKKTGGFEAHSLSEIKTFKEFTNKYLNMEGGFNDKVQRWGKLEQEMLDLKQAKKAKGRPTKEYQNKLIELETAEIEANNAYAQFLTDIFAVYEENPLIRQQVYDPIKNYNVSKLNDKGVRFEDIANTPTQQKFYKNIPVVDDPELLSAKNPYAPAGAVAWISHTPKELKPGFTGPTGAAQPDQRVHQIIIDRKKIRQDYEQGLAETAQGMTPGFEYAGRDLEVGEAIWKRVRADKETFPTYEDFENFVLEHEYQHFANPGQLQKLTQTERENLVEAQAYLNQKRTNVARERLTEEGLSPGEASGIVGMKSSMDPPGTIGGYVGNIQYKQTDSFANLNQVRNVMFPPQRGVSKGSLMIGDEARAPITNAKAAFSILKATQRGLDNNKLVISTKSKKKLGGSIDDIINDDPSVSNALMRNFKREIDRAYDNPDSPMYNKGKKADAFSWIDNDGVTRVHHFGDNFMSDPKYTGKKFEWDNIRKMGGLTNDMINDLVKNNTDLVAPKKDQIVMNITDFLDMAGMVVDWQGPMGKPIRMYEQYFNLPAEVNNYLKRYYNVYDEGAHLLKRKGINVDNLFDNTTGNYVHHMAEAQNEVQGLVDAQDVSRIAGGPLRTTTIKRNRVFDNVLDGIEDEARGLIYQQDETIMLEEFLKSVYKEVADEGVVRRLENISHKQLKAAKINTKKLNEYRDRAKTFREKQSELASIKNFTTVGAQLGNDIVDDLNKALRESKTDLLAGIQGTSKNWNKEYNKIKDILKSNDPSAHEDVNRIIKDFLDDLDVRYEKETRNYTEFVKQYIDKKDFVLNDKTRKLSNLYGEENLRFRAVRDQRGDIKNEVKALRDRDLFFNDKTAKHIERVLNINEENSFDRFLKTTSDVNDYLRVVQTGFDAGTGFLHGLPTLMKGIAAIPTQGPNNPYLKTWSKASVNMFRLITAGSDAPRIHAELIAKKHENFSRMANYGVLISSAGQDYFRVRGQKNAFTKLLTEGRLTNTAAKDSVPGFKRARYFIEKGSNVLDGFQSSFEAYGDIIREGLWEAGEKAILNKNIPADVMERQLRQLGEHINGMTGAFSSRRAGISARQSNIERSVVFFSPAYTRSTIGLVGSVLKGNLQGDEARSAIRAMMGAGIATHVGFAAMSAKAAGKNIEDYIHLDPSSGKFLSTEIGGINVGFGSSWVSLARLFGKLADDPAFRGDILDSPLLLTGAGRGKAGFDDQGIKDYLHNNQLAYWIRSRSSPVGSTMWDTAMGANFLGEEMKPFRGDWFRKLGLKSMPFWLESILQNGDWNLLSGGTEFVGLRTSPISEYEKRKEVRDMLAQQYFNVNWRNMNDVQKRIINSAPDLEADPNVQRLRQLEEEIFEKRRVVGGSSLDRNFELKDNDVDDAREEYLEEVRESESRLRSNMISIEQYVLEEQKARSQYRYEVQAIQEKYPDVDAYFQAIKGKMGEFEKVEDFAADEYAEIMFDDKWDLGYMFDFEARELELDGWREKWAIPEYEAYAKDKLYGARWDTTGFNQEFYRRRDEYFPQYWEDTRKEVFQTRYQGQFDTVYREWYLSKYNDRKQKLIEDNNPGFKQALREWERIRVELRKVNPALDAFLYRWGFAESLMSPFNAGREDELKSAFPFEEYLPQHGVAGQ